MFSHLLDIFYCTGATCACFRFHQWRRGCSLFNYSAEMLMMIV